MTGHLFCYCFPQYDSWWTKRKELPRVKINENYSSSHFYPFLLVYLVDCPYRGLKGQSKWDPSPCPHSGFPSSSVSKNTAEGQGGTEIYPALGR